MVKIKHKDPTTQALIDALQKVFGVGEKQKKFVDVGRIPLLCKSVIEMRSDIKEIKENQMNLETAIKNTVQVLTTQEIKEKKEGEDKEAKRKKLEEWKDWGLRMAVNAAIWIIILLLIRTKIIDIRTIVLP